jgi:hypothetical protein
MKRWLRFLAVTGALASAGAYGWNHLRAALAAAAVEKQEEENKPATPEGDDAGRMVSVRGVLADRMLRHMPFMVETLQPESDKVVASDHVGDSPVGTSNTILHKTFNVAHVVDLPFDIPAHAASAQLRGAYHSFAQGAGAETSDDIANVDFLLLNQQQYTDLVNGRPNETVFAAEDAHDQEVNFSFPPTLDRPARYYLVFRNGAPGKVRKLVQADFRVDF